MCAFIPVVFASVWPDSLSYSFLLSISTYILRRNGKQHVCHHLKIFQQLLVVDRVVLFLSTITLLFNNFDLIFALRHIDIDICQSNMYREKTINKTRLIGSFSSKYEFTSEIKVLMNVIRVKTS